MLNENNTHFCVQKKAEEEERRKLLLLVQISRMYIGTNTGDKF